MKAQSYTKWPVAWGFGLLLLLAATAQAWLVGAAVFQRPFWLDETLTFLIASDADLNHSLAALAGGADTNPPGLHLTMRAVGGIFGHTPGVYRATMFLTMSTAIVLLYALLRKTLPARTAAAAAMFAWAVPMVRDHSVDARFYAPMLLAAVACCAALSWRRGGLTRTSAAFSSASLAGASVYLCLIHYFGVLVLACIAGGELTMGRGTLRDRLSRTMPMICGVVATACCWPLLMGQRAALREAGGTWVPDDWSQTMSAVIGGFTPVVPTAIAVVLMIAATFGPGLKRVRIRLNAIPPGVLGLLAYPLVLIAIDRLVQPVLAPRYVLPLLLPIAAIVAGFAATLGKRVERLAIIALLAVIADQSLDLRHRAQRPDPRSAIAFTRVIPANATLPIYVDWRGYALPLAVARNDLRSNVRYFFDPRIRCDLLQESLGFEARMAEINFQFFGLPQPAKLDAVRLSSRFLLITEFPETVAERFAEFHSRRIGPLEFEMSRLADRADHTDARE